jgi:hypothetical protein
MASKTDIANLALQHLGTSKINSLEDAGDKVSRTLALNYPQARDEVLQSARWSCCKKQATLSKLADEPLFKWASAYQLPSDCLRLVEIEGDNAWVGREYFDIQGKTLLIGPADDTADMPDTLNIEYIASIDDPTFYTPLLIECIALKLAAKCARTLTGSDSLADKLAEQYLKFAEPQAIMVNAQATNSGKNHPIRQILAKSFMGKARKTGGFGDLDAAAYPPGAGTPVAEEISDWSGEIE